MYNKQYNNWISKNFDGLSAHTLCQILSSFFTDKIYIDEWVYVTLFDYFRGDHSDKCTDCFKATQELIEEYWR